MTALTLNNDRLFPGDPATRAIAGTFYETVRHLPIISPHGHTDPRWFAEDIPFENATQLLVTPDHYVFRMLYSQGVSMEDIGIPPSDGAAYERDPRTVWRTFARHWHAFRGTPTRMWIDHEFSEVLGIKVRFSAATADEIYDAINARLATPEFRPRALCERFNIEVLSTTDSPLSDLRYHKMIMDSDWSGRVVPAFRPDSVVDPEYFPDFHGDVEKMGELTNEDVSHWQGYLRALEARRRFFIEHGATSTDHGHPTAGTADLEASECERLYQKIIKGTYSPDEAELFRRQMLSEMARMSIEDGLVMQIHPGCLRSHNDTVYQRFGRDMGGDIPVRTDYATMLRPLLNKYGNDAALSLILFTLDETSFSRELAPLAGHYPSVRLGPPWWFLDSPEAMMRFREAATETAGFYNTVGFNDDTRAFLSIPARHDIARRVDCSYLARLVVEHRIDEDEAHEVVRALAYDLPKAAYKL